MQKIHEWTGPTGKKFRDIADLSFTYYRDTTPRAVIDAIEHARETRARVRLFYGDAETGRDWGESYDVTGRVGRSMGLIKIPLLIPTSRSMGGPAILCDCIVRLIVAGREVYRHPNYHQPEYTIRHEGPGDLRKRVYADGKTNIANFRTQRQAERWIAFMKGERMNK